MIDWLVMAATTTAAASLAAVSSPIIGTWSVGEQQNCTAGTVWVFHKDGYYVEVQLPGKGPTSVGTWKDNGSTIEYTHSHMPFSDMMIGAPPRRFVVEARSLDRLALKTWRGTQLVLNRCPDDTVRAPPGKAEH